MSYNCDECGVHVSHGTKMIRKVTETRNKTYPSGGVGFETVVEKSVCSKCKGE